MIKKWLCLTPLFIMLAGCSDLSKEQLDSIEIRGYYGQYDASQKHFAKPSSSLTLMEDDQWLFTSDKDNPPRRIGVLFPNTEENDPYWTAVRHGIEAEAKRANISIELKVSDNYESLNQHRQQFTELADSDVDALIIGSMHYRAMDKQINRVKQKHSGQDLPVIAIINDLYANEVDGKVMVPFLDMGYEAGEFIKRHAAREGKESITVAFLPGPINAGWAPDSLMGFVHSMRDYNGVFELVGPFWGGVDSQLQQQLIEKVFEGSKPVNYIVGNAVAAGKAAELIRVMGLEEDVHVVSTYYSPALEPMIQSGEVLAAPSDQTELLGRIAVDMAQRILKGEQSGKDFPFRVSPDIPVITAYEFE